MYITLRGTPQGHGTSDGELRNGAVPVRSRVPSTVIGLGVVSLFTDISSESVAAILPIYITVVVGLGPLAFGFIDGIYQGISAFVRIAGGRWADRSDRPKWVAFVGYGLSALTRLGLLFVSGFWAITSVVAVDRLGKGLRTGPRDALIATASDPARLGRNFGVHRAMDTAGALIGPLMAFAILAVFPIGLGGYQTVFVWSFAFAIIGVAVLALAVPDLRSRSSTTAARATRADPTDTAGATDPGGSTTGPTEPKPATPSTQPAPARPRWRDLATPGLRRLLIAAAVLSLVTIGDGFLYLALENTGDISAAYFPLLFVGTNFAYLSLAVPMGKLADRIGRGKVFVGGYVLLLLAYGVAGLAVGGLVGVLMVLLLLGTFYAATDGVMSALASRLVPAASRASGISAAQTVVAVFRFVASVGFGILWQFGSLQIAMLVMGIGLAAAIPLAGWLLRIRTERPPAGEPA